MAWTSPDQPSAAEAWIRFARAVALMSLSWAGTTCSSAGAVAHAIATTATTIQRAAGSMVFTVRGCTERAPLSDGTTTSSRYDGAMRQVLLLL